MLRRFRLNIPENYPRQFWLLFWGMLLNASGGSMIWPFLMIYVSGRLHLPMAQSATLMTINAATGMAFAFIAGPLADRLGRKGVMVTSLIVNGVGYIVMSRADSLWSFALLMGLQGAFNPLYRVGADAMLADLIPAENRMEAYSWLRMSNNLGVAIGPALGGLIASTSYAYAFYMAAFSFLAYGLLLLLKAKETLPAHSKASSQGAPGLAGYGTIFKDNRFLSFVGAFTLTQMTSLMIWVLMGVYAKTHYGLPESAYGLIPMTNAIMVVVLQVGVTSVTKRYPPLVVLAVGAMMYAGGAASVAFAHNFWGFWGAMVIATFGELIMIPTSNSYAANLAPESMRGRYMSIYGLTSGVAMAIAPVTGGWLNDNIGPRVTWYGAGLIGAISALVFLVIARRYPHERQKSAEATPGD